MFGGFLEKLLGSIGAVMLTEWFIAALLILFLLATLLLFTGRLKVFTRTVPGLLTSIGILGTFAGVVTGLLDFDPSPERLDNSVSLLLEGLKTAFLSSLAGMFLAILFLVMSIQALRMEQKSNRKQITVKDLYDLQSHQVELVTKQTQFLQKQTNETMTLASAVNELIMVTSGTGQGEMIELVSTIRDENRSLGERNTKLAEEQRDGVISLAAAISDSSESSINGQLKIMRSDFLDASKSHRLLGEQQFEVNREAMSAVSSIQKLQVERASQQDIAQTNMQSMLESQIQKLEGISTESQGMHKVLKGTEVAHTALLSAIRDEHQSIAERNIKLAVEQRDGINSLGTEIRDSSELLSKQIQESSKSHEFSIENQNKILDGVARTSEETRDVLRETKTDNAESRQKFNDEIKEIQKLLSTSPTEQVIVALAKVTKEFNKVIIDQFGDNFKHLNLAVEKLVEWQDNYRQQMADMDQQYKASVSAIKSTEQSVGAIGKSTSVIPGYMEQLKSILLSNQAQVEQLQGHLAAFADVREKAVQAFPEIQKQAELMLTDIRTANTEMVQGIKGSSGDMLSAIGQSVDDYSSSTKSNNEHLRETGELLKRSVSEVKEDSSAISTGFKQFSDQFVESAGTARKVFEEGLDKSHAKLHEKIYESADKHATAATQIHQDLSNTIDKSLEQTGKNISSTLEVSIKNIADARNQEVEKVMVQMGEALANITGTFTEDYTKLVSAMDKVVRHHADGGGLQ